MKTWDYAIAYFVVLHVLIQYFGNVKRMVSISFLIVNDSFNSPKPGIHFVIAPTLKSRFLIDRIISLIKTNIFCHHECCFFHRDTADSHHAP